MTYKEKIESILKKVPKTIVDIRIGRKRKNPPTVAYGEFLTNREQGDWAEKLIINAFNTLSKNYIAVLYGKTDDIIAGEEGFDQFYENYQDELDEIGKRPDLLIFKVEDYNKNWNNNISKFSKKQLDKIVPKAIAGVEIRSSSFLINKYDEYMQKRQKELIEKCLILKKDLLTNYLDVLSLKEGWIKELESINELNLHIKSFNAPGWRSSVKLTNASEKIKELKSYIKEYQKRDFLSITPKVEDIKVVFKWIQTYNVPHYYFQVFFDKVYAISFENILKIISNSDNEEKIFFVESKDAKNQNKSTIKIKSKAGIEIGYKVDMPKHSSKLRNLDRGRLLFYVTFEGGCAYLDVNNLINVLCLEEKF
jgi:type II restriction enzyme